MASPTLVDFSVATTTYASSLQAQYTGLTVTAGDFLLIIAYCDSSHVLSINNTEFIALYGTSNGGYCSQYAWYKLAGVTESAPTISLDAGSEPMKVVAITVTGWDTASTVRSNTNIGLSTLLTAPDVSATTDWLALRACCHRNTNFTFTTPSTEIERGNTGTVSSTHIYAGESQAGQTGPGQVGEANFTATGDVRYIAATIVVLGSGGSASSSLTDWEDPWYSAAEGVISGVDFEATQGAGTVTLEQDAESASFTVSSWSDTELTVVAPAMLSTSLRNSPQTTLLVTPDSSAASSQIIEFSYSALHRYVDVTTLAADTDTRIEASGLATDWQLLYSKYLLSSAGAALSIDYLIEVRSDGTFTIAGQPPDGTYKINVAEYNNSTNLWGSFIAQTVVINTGVDQPTGDTTAPVVTAPSNLTINIAASASGVFHTNTTLVNWIATATAVDAVDGTTTVTTNLSSQTNPLPVGTTTITFSSTDENGNIGTDTADVIVTQAATDTTAPVVTAPPAITLSFPFGAQGLAQDNSSLVAWLGQVVSIDDIDGNISSAVTNNLVTLQNPIPAGIYPITFTSIDDAGNTGTANGTLTVTQSSAPASGSGVMSGSVNFVVTCHQIITDAYTHIGCLAEGESLTTYREEYALRQLNKMIKAWSVQGYRLWTILEGSLTLVAAQRSYTIGSGGNLNIPRPLRVLNARFRDSDGIDIPVDVVPRNEYFDQPNKGATGQTTMIFYDPQFTGSSRTPKGTLYVWPVLASGESGTIQFTYTQYIQDIDDCDLDDTPLPVEWSEALSWGLAARLATGENLSTNDFLTVKGMADQMLKDVQDNDVDTESYVNFSCE